MSLEPVPVETTPARGLRPRTVLILALLALVVGAVLAALAIDRWGSWNGRAPAARPATPQAALTPAGGATAPVDPSAQSVPPPDDAMTMAETAAREAALSGRIASLETRLANIDLRAAAASGNAARAEGLLVAFAARRALDRGLGLGYLEAQLRDRFGAGQPRAVALVIRAARTPVTLEQLRIGFDELAPELTTGAVGEDWWQGMRRQLAGLLVVRRAGAPSPRVPDRIQRAHRMLEGDRVDAALADVARLPGRAKADAWMAQARRYVEARQALDVLETAAIVEPQRAATSAASLSSTLPAPPAAAPQPLPAPTN